MVKVGLFDDHDHMTEPAMMQHVMVMESVFVNTSKVTLFFKAWKTDNSPTGYGFILVGLVIFAILAMGLKYARLLYNIKRVATQGSSLNLIHNIVLLILTVLMYTADFLLMLAAMTFNVGIFISIIAGLALGSVFFNQQVLKSRAKQPPMDSVDSATCCA